ncbi:MAG: repair protein SbcD/Mre11 [Solirubrobacteraceae bacterium]|jgi:exonuclease SbcD|nr:repair protein SbcD/Mre11 [Solirubrobacteraceae bacterium]
MRFLHTADWHLGRTFHGEDLLSHQAAWADWLVALARDEQADAILVAGDLYDRALPPVDAVALADELLGRLAERAPVIVIAGNHDSAQRLRFGAGLLARGGLHLRTDPLGCADPVLLGGVAVYGLPYLEPDLARGPLGCEERGHAAVLAAAMARVRSDVARRPAGTRSVVLAHAFVAGAAPSESERDLAVGGAASVPASTFAGVDYVALGHLHAPQRVGANGRYAGSPVAFSFSEAGHEKSVCVVEVAEEVVTRVVACPVARPLARLRGTLDELLADPAHRAAEGAWVQVTLTDPVRASDAMERLRRRFPHTAALLFDPQGATAGADGTYAARLRGLDDDGLVARFVADVRGTEADQDELALLRDALAAQRVREAVA